MGDRAQSRLHQPMRFVCLHRHGDRRPVRWFNIQFLRKANYETKPKPFSRARSRTVKIQIPREDQILRSVKICTLLMTNLVMVRLSTNTFKAPEYPGLFVDG